MRLSQEKMLALMAFADGELAGEEKAQVEALLATSEDARRVVAAMRGDTSAVAVDAWLAKQSKQGSDEGATKRHPADGIADVVMSRIEAEGPAVTSLAAAREKRAARVRNFAMVGAAITAIAAAAALVITGGQAPVKDKTAETINPDTTAPGHTNTAQEVLTVPPPPAPVASNEVRPVPTIDPAPVNNNPSVVADNEGVEVHEVESPHDVSVIYLPPAVGAAAANMTPQSVVVWLGEGSR